MNAYTYAKLAHVLSAVLAMGLATACAVLARRTSGVPLRALRSLVRLASVGFVFMVASGLLLDYLVAGAFHATRWFRIGFGWTVAAGIILGYAQRVIARGIAEKLDPKPAHRRLWVASSLALACVAMAVAVMVRKP
jgi:hypothetical protein